MAADAPLRCRCGRIIGAADPPPKGCCPDWLLGRLPMPRIGRVQAEGER